MSPERFDWEDNRPDEWIDESPDELVDCLEALTEEEAVYRGFRKADIAKAKQKIRASRCL